MIFLVKMTVMAGGLLATAALLTGCGLRDITQAANQATLGPRWTQETLRESG